jgi:hypothetical protein
LNWINARLLWVLVASQTLSRVINNDEPAALTQGGGHEVRGGICLRAQTRHVVFVGELLAEEFDGALATEVGHYPNSTVMRTTLPVRRSSAAHTLQRGFAGTEIAIDPVP